MINNRNDDTAFERVINTPPRGLGDKTLETIRFAARDRGCTLWDASVGLLNDQVLTGRAASALSRFVELINALEEEGIDMPLHVLTDHAVKPLVCWRCISKKKAKNPKRGLKT